MKEPPTIIRLMPLGLTLVVALASCVLTDTFEIERGEIENQHAVRLVETMTLSAEAECSCEATPGSCDPSSCPQPPPTGLPHFLDPSQERYSFCACDGDSYDDNALGIVEFYAEDEDQHPGTRHEDELYAALLLDHDAADDPQSSAAAYTHPERFERDHSQYAALIINRPDPLTRKLVVKDDSEREVFDLCNPKTKEKMGQRFHTLTVVATDRPWFSVTGNNNPPQVGVPDIANGATWDRLDYVFRCSDEHEKQFDAQGVLKVDPYGCAESCIDPGDDLGG
ncbi:MAG: hypothetical protein V3V08_24105 [Nannocystaceae bacterium]